MALTAEQIVKITRKRKGRFRPTQTTRLIQQTYDKENNTLIDEESQFEARSWHLLGHCEVGGKITPPPPFPEPCKVCRHMH